MKFQKLYSKTTSLKDRAQGTEAQIKVKYDSGALSVPCVRLQCIDFDEAFFNYLVLARLSRRRSMISLPPANKRRRGTQDEGDGRHRKMQSVS